MAPLSSSAHTTVDGLSTVTVVGVHRVECAQIDGVMVHIQGTSSGYGQTSPKEGEKLNKNIHGQK